MAGRGPFAVDDDLMYSHPDELMGRALGSDVALGNNMVAGEYGGMPTSTAVRMGVAPAGTNEGANAPTPSAAAAKPAAGGASPIDPAVQPAAAVTAPQPAIAAPPAPPTRDMSRMGELEAQRDKLNKPTDPNSVRPSLWRQILGYGAAAAGGYASQMGRHPYETNIGERVGKSLWQDPLDRAEKQRTGELDEVNKSINQENQKYHDAMEGFQATVTGYNAETSRKRADLETKQFEQGQNDIAKQWTAVDPKDGKVHQYGQTKGGKTIDQGVAPKDADQEDRQTRNKETERHDRAMEGIDATRANREKSSDHAIQLSGVEKWKQDSYAKLEGEKRDGMAKAAESIDAAGIKTILPVGDPQRTAREKAVNDAYEQQRGMIENGYNAQRAQLGADNSTPAQQTASGSKTSQVSAPTAELHSSVTETRVDKSPSGQPRQGERVEVVDKKGKRFTVPASQLAQALKQGYKQAGKK